MSFISKIKSGWNAFVDDEKNVDYAMIDYGTGYGSRPDRVRMSIGGERTIISSIYTRLSIDVASVNIKHARLDVDGRYVGDIASDLNECLTLEANVDQAARAFRQDIAMTIFDKGVAAIVPVDTKTSPRLSNAYDITTMRVGEVVEWMPRHVRINVYNDRKGLREDVVLPKTFVAIVTNPLFAVMNEPNSTLQRLIKKLNLLDQVDVSSSGNLDLIIQLPYVIKSEARKQQAEARRKDIEVQLSQGSRGIAYTDGTEKITQLNRPVESTLLKQIEDLTAQLYAQLGLTPSVFDGTADEAAMLNYNNRTIEPVVGAIAESMKRSFLTKTSRSQGQSIEYFTDPFKLVPIGDISEIADKFTRNEILSANEIRSIVGFKPSKDPKAEELRNSNMPTPADHGNQEPVEGSMESDGTSVALDELDVMVAEMLAEAGVSDDDD